MITSGGDTNVSSLSHQLGSVHFSPSRDDFRLSDSLLGSRAGEQVLKFFREPEGGSGSEGNRSDPVSKFTNKREREGV
jgi:hypothetical protein